MILIGTLVGALLGFGISMLMTPQYQAESRLFVSVRVPVVKGNYYSGDLFVQQRVASYEEVVNSPSVLDPVIAQLGLETTAKDLSDKISVASPTGTVLFDVTATADSPESAVELADAVTASYAAEIERLEGAAAAQGEAPGIPKYRSECRSSSLRRYQRQPRRRAFRSMWRSVVSSACSSAPP